MSTEQKQAKEIKLNADVVEAAETIRKNGGITFSETGQGSASVEAVTEVSSRFYTPDEEKRVHKGRDVLMAATALVFSEVAPGFLKDNEKVGEATFTHSLNKDTIGHSMNREGAMLSSYDARGVNGPELKKVYKLMANKVAEE